MNTPRHRILVVDDEPVIRLFLQELFEDEGYEVITGQSIAEGLEALRAHELNLVVTDKNLPDGTGFEIVHAAKAQTPPCEAMLITGYASLDSAVMALQIGAYDYILKPIEDVDLLLEKARKAIEKQELWRELQELREKAGAGTSSTESAPAPPGEKTDRPTLAMAPDDLPQLMKLAELGSLIPMLAHELRQPLAGVKGYVDLMLHKKNLEPAFAGKLETIREQVSHMASLVDSLTCYSRVSADTTHVDVGRVLERALSIFPALTTSGRYELKVTLEDDLPPVKANANSVQQVIVNLLKNAKDALDETGGGTLAVTVSHDADAHQLRVRVQDTGPGISTAAREHLFDAFFTTKQEGVGTGLGLTICRQIMGSAGGSILVNSPLGPDGGTAFTLVFPAVTDAALVTP